MTIRLLRVCVGRKRGRGKWEFGTGAEAPLPTPDSVVIVTEPTGAENGVPFTTQPAVQMQKGGVDLARAGFELNASVLTGTGTTGGTVRANSDSSGRYTWSGLLVNGSGNHTLRFSGGAGTDDSASFNVTTPSVQSQLGLTTQPGNAITATVFGV